MPVARLRPTERPYEWARSETTVVTSLTAIWWCEHITSGEYFIDQNVEPGHLGYSLGGVGTPSSDDKKHFNRRRSHGLLANAPFMEQEHAPLHRKRMVDVRGSESGLPALDTFNASRAVRGTKLLANANTIG